jgi:anoctamin-1
MAVVLVAVVGVIIYRIAIAAVLFTQSADNLVKGKAGLIASATAACINLVIIFILNFVSNSFTVITRRISSNDSGHTGN